MPYANELNYYTYASETKDELIFEAIVDAAKKAYGVHLMGLTDNKLLVGAPNPLWVEDLYTLQVWLYKMHPTPAQCWMHHHTAMRKDIVLWRTRRIITNVCVEEFDVKEWLQDKVVKISVSQPGEPVGV